MIRHLRTLVLVTSFSITTSAFAQSWADRLNFSNDFRLRTEYAETTHSSTHPSIRQRLRARLGFGYDVNEEVSAGLNLISGADDPTSTNDTLDNGFVKKDIQIQEVYAKWTPLKELNVFLGKTGPVFYTISKNELIWDNDVRPEGMAARYAVKAGEWNLTANTAFYWVDQNSDDSSQILLSGLQLMAQGPVSGDVILEVGAGAYDFSHAEGHVAIDSAFDGTGAANGHGNTLSGNNYAVGYQPVEGFLGLTYNGFVLPVSVFYNMVHNARATSEQNGFIAGLSVGRVKEIGDWAVKYSYRQVEADAVLGAFNDSDFNNGNTNGQGSEFNFNYGLAKNTNVGLILFLNDTEADGGGNQVYRGQIDLLFRF